jgi:hypothetical protein
MLFPICSATKDDLALVTTADHMVKRLDKFHFGLRAIRFLYQTLTIMRYESLTVVSPLVYCKFHGGRR